MQFELSKTNKTLIASLLFMATLSSIGMHYFAVFITLATILLLIAIYLKFISKKLALVCILIISFGYFYTAYRAPKPDDLYKTAPLEATLKGTIVSTPIEKDKRKLKFELAVNSYQLTPDNWKKTNSKILLSIFEDNANGKKLFIGDEIELSAKIKRPFEATNPGQFDYKQYLSNKNIFTLGYAPSGNITQISPPETLYWRFMQDINKITNSIIEKHKSYLKSPKYEILCGVVFGDDAIPPPNEVKKDFINSGLFHLLAASGMNVTLVFGIWFYILQKLKVPFNINIVSGGAVVLIYSIMTGLPPSVLRAAGMLEFILIGRLLDRKADNLALLALVGALLLVWNPFLINSISFQLSFLVTFGLLLFMPILMEKTSKIPPLLSGAILLPIVAQLWAAPIQAYYFNTFATYSIFANILVMPVMAIISFAGFIGSLLSFLPLIGDKICFLADKISEPFINWLLGVSSFFSEINHSVEILAKPSILAILLFYSFLLILLLCIKQDFKKSLSNLSLGIISLLLIGMLLLSNFSNRLEIIFFDAGEGDSILIRTPARKTMLIDTGRYYKGGFTLPKTAIIPYLNDVGAKKIDLLVLTHPDSDHIGGTLDLLKGFEVERIIDNGAQSDSKTYQKLYSYIKNKHYNVQTLKPKEYLEVDDRLKILAIKPENTDKESNNDDSIVIKVAYGDFSTIFMGDKESDSTDLLKEEGFDTADVLKAGHHGSYKSLSEGLLALIKPQMAVISVGENGYGHPANNIINLLERNEIGYLRTDRNHAVRVVSGGHGYKAYSFDTNKKRWENIKKVKNSP